MSMNYDKNLYLFHIYFYNISLNLKIFVYFDLMLCNSLNYLLTNNFVYIQTYSIIFVLTHLHVHILNIYR